VVESSGLLNRRRVKNSTGGSNPPLSAINNLQAFPIFRFERIRRLLTKLSDLVDCVCDRLLIMQVRPPRGLVVSPGHYMCVDVYGEARAGVAKSAAYEPIKGSGPSAGAHNRVCGGFCARTGEKPIDNRCLQGGTNASEDKTQSVMHREQLVYPRHRTEDHAR
jgi:hypothetical protein